MTALVPASASMQRCTIPSPPQTNTNSAPCASARRAALGALRLFGTSYHSGSSMPLAASTLRNSGKPPSRLLPECATTATVGGQRSARIGIRANCPGSGHSRMTPPRGWLAASGGRPGID